MHYLMGCVPRQAWRHVISRHRSGRNVGVRDLVNGQHADTVDADEHRRRVVVRVTFVDDVTSFVHVT